ncbi:MAG: hypothetical protein DWH84_00210 [Planctomycetota bacterium]|nr:MAG: hypothetical protein DWH84_00210 [Planctomycetota bacterium]
MNIKTFARRLEEGKANNLTYSKDGNEGLISIWKHESSLILTWEECPKGEQYDESNYTRDERHVFDDFDKMMEFLTSKALTPDSFTP